MMQWNTSTSAKMASSAVSSNSAGGTWANGWAHPRAAIRRKVSSRSQMRSQPLVLSGARPSAEHQRHVAARVREEVLAAGTGARAQRQPLQQVDDEAAARPR